MLRKRERETERAKRESAKQSEERRDFEELSCSPEQLKDGEYVWERTSEGVSSRRPSAESRASANRSTTHVNKAKA